MSEKIEITGDAEQVDREIERLFESGEVFPAGADSRSGEDGEPR